MEKSHGLHNNNQYSLSIRFNSDGFSLLVYDAENSLLSSKQIGVLLFSLSEEEIIRLLLSEIDTAEKIKDIRLICETDAYCFVPMPIFKSEEAADFLHFQHKPNKGEHISYNLISRWDVVNVFAIPQTVHNALAHIFPLVQIEHHLSWFISDKIAQQMKTGIDVWVRSTTLDVVVVRNGNIMLINSFGYHTPEDFTFHLLHVVEQLEIDAEKSEVRLFNGNQKPELKNLLQKYIAVTNFNK